MGETEHSGQRHHIKSERSITVFLADVLHSSPRTSVNCKVAQLICTNASNMSQ